VLDGYESAGEVMPDDVMRDEHGGVVTD